MTDSNVANSKASNRLFSLVKLPYYNVPTCFHCRTSPSSNNIIFRNFLGEACTRPQRHYSCTLI